jgi:hypothetical protein
MKGGQYERRTICLMGLSLQVTTFCVVSISMGVI